MRIVDIYKPRRASRLATCDIDYVPIDRDDEFPKGDALLVPSAWWYKKKYKKYAKKANEFKGLLVMVDYGREMWQTRKNVTGINPNFLAMLKDYTPNDVKTIPFAMPSFDPYPGVKDKHSVEFEIFVKDKKVALITMEKPRGGVVTSLIKKMRKEDYYVIWKMRIKWKGMLTYYQKKLIPCNASIILPDNKDYNNEIPLVEYFAEFADIHINVETRSFANQEMIRYGVPTHVWDGKNLVSHELIEWTKKHFEGKPKDYCTQNLLRGIRENINISR